jgi:hypothetical protein
VSIDTDDECGAIVRAAIARERADVISIFGETLKVFSKEFQARGAIGHH